MSIKMYIVVFRMEEHDPPHTIIRPFADHIPDKRSLMSEELRIPKRYIESIAPVITEPARIDDDLRLGNLLYKKKEMGNEE